MHLYHRNVEISISMEHTTHKSLHILLFITSGCHGFTPLKQQQQKATVLIIAIVVSTTIWAATPATMPDHMKD